MTEENNNGAAKTQNADPAVKGEQTAQGRTFTQEEVNQIVSNRLAQERAKNEPSPADTREQELSKRESRVACQEYMINNRYPVKLLDILPTSNPQDFQNIVEQLKKDFPAIFSAGEGVQVNTGSEHGAGLNLKNPLAEAFARKG